MRRLLTIWAGVAATLLLLALAVSTPPTAVAEEEGGLDGQEIFMAQNCNMCHAVSSAGIEAKTTSEKMKGPDLVGIDKDAEWLAQYLKKEVEMNDGLHKKEFKGSDEELQALIDWLLEQRPAEKGGSAEEG